MAARRISAKQGAAKYLKLRWLLAGPVLACPFALLAQEAGTGGATVTFDIGQRFEYIEEEGFSGLNSDEGLRSVTSLGFDYTTETRSQALAFGLSTGLVQNLTNGGPTEFESTRASLDYRLFNRNTEVSLGGFYVRDEIDDLAFDTSLADTTITTGDGQREIYNLTTGLIVGREGPVTGTLTHVFEKSEYSDTTDPTLIDSYIRRLDGRLAFKLAPNLETYILGSKSEEDEQGAGATDRERTRAGIGAIYEITPATTLSGEIAYSTEESTGVLVDETSGMNYAFSLAHERPNGEISVDLSEEDTVNGKRREFRLGRSYVFRRGELAFSLGATKTDGFSAQPLANLSLDFEIDRNSDIEISLEQSGDVDGDNNEVVNTRLGIEYVRELNSLSQISAGLSLVEENALSAGGIDRRSVRFDVSHAYEISRDWDLVSGFEHSTVSEDLQPTRKRNRLFVGVQRSFNYRP